VEDSPCINFIN